REETQSSGSRTWPTHDSSDMVAREKQSNVRRSFKKHLKILAGCSESHGFSFHLRDQCTKSESTREPPVLADSRKCISGLDSFETLPSGAKYLRLC
ncbi:MAG: hypothetical protein ACK5VR_07055, partial [Burkholderiales bacterium]